MSDPFVGEIRIFAGSFAPRDWAFCNGQTLPIAQHTALFSVVSTIYGGDGTTDFGVPDLVGRFPMHAGAGPGLTTRLVGQLGGSDHVTLTPAQIPAHTHSWGASGEDADSDDPEARYVAVVRDDSFSTSGGTAMAADAIGSAGGGAGHNNLQPFLALNFIISLMGVPPSPPG